MWLFGNRKKQKEAELKKQEELAKQVRIEEEKRQAKIKEEQKIQAEVKTEKTEVKKEAKPATEKTVAKAEEKKGPSGKYEIYPEAGLFKYRLKASNGEILGVSFGYSTRKSAANGIETFKKAVETGNFEISTDKSSYSHYDLFGARGARVVIIGEFYKTLKLAESAVESVKKFYGTEKIINLDEIPAAEIREEVVAKQKIESKANGKYQLVKEGPKDFYVKLLASNGQVLLVSQKYASKQSALNGLDTIKNAIDNQNFTISRDKQNRYQYNLYSSNKQLIVSGETYPVKQSCLSSIQSVIRFADKAKFVEL